MRADLLLDYDTIPLDQQGRVHLMVRFTSGPAPSATHRRPLNLSLVIDRSGSMAGQKLDFTRQAAQFMVQNLNSNDTLSIVLYNDRVETLLPPEPVRRKDVIAQRIAQIKASGTTNLSGGWLEGCNLVTQSMVADHLNRVIMMSDGLANRGITSASRLVDMARQKNEMGVSTTTMGLGNDFNEDLLMEMASAGGGAFYFIESPEVTPAIFQEELQGLLNVVGQNLTVTLTTASGVSVGQQLNAYPHQQDGATSSYRLGDIYGDEVKALVVPLEIAPISVRGIHQIGVLTYEYDAMNEATPEHRKMQLAVNLTVGIPAGQRQLPNPQVKQSMLLLQAAQARRHAVVAADQGDYGRAAGLLRSAAESIGNQADPQLQEEKAALMEQAGQMAQGAARYDVYSRKTLSTQAFYTMTSRHDDTMMLRGREAQKRQTQEVHSAAATDANVSIGAGAVVSRHQGVPPTHVTWNGQTFPIEGDLVRIGRANHNEIVIGVKGISRFHCQIKRDDRGNLLLEDLGSTNGTLIGGQLIKAPHPLSVGDVVYLCDEKLVFHDIGHTAAIQIE